VVFNNGINQSDPDGGGFVWFYMLLAAIVCVAALFFSMVTGLSVLRYNQLVEHANVTQGVLIGPVINNVWLQSHAWKSVKTIIKRRLSRPQSMYSITPMKREHGLNRSIIRHALAKLGI